jgi:hypothetical protein
MLDVMNKKVMRIIVISITIMLATGCTSNRYIGPGGSNRNDQNSLTPEKERKIDQGEARARGAYGLMNLF